MRAVGARIFSPFSASFYSTSKYRIVACKAPKMGVAFVTTKQCARLHDATAKKQIPSVQFLRLVYWKTCAILYVDSTPSVNNSACALPKRSGNRPKVEHNVSQNFIEHQNFIARTPTCSVVQKDNG